MPETFPQFSVTGLILAGGRGRRMGGEDKGLLPLGQRPALEYLIEALATQTDALLISANRNIDQYRRYGYPVVRDAQADFAGPLAGLLAALRHCRTDYLLCVPCDAPLLAPDYAARMRAALQASAAAACVAHDGEREQPVHLLLASSLATGLERFLASGQRKVLDWLHTLHPAQADFSDHPEQFWNMNTPEQRLCLEQYLARSR